MRRSVVRAACAVAVGLAVNAAALTMLPSDAAAQGGPPPPPPPPTHSPTGAHHAHVPAGAWYVGKFAGSIGFFMALTAYRGEVLGRETTLCEARKELFEAISPIPFVVYFLMATTCQDSPRSFAVAKLARDIHARCAMGTPADDAILDLYADAYRTPGPLDRAWNRRIGGVHCP